MTAATKRKAESKSTSVKSAKKIKSTTKKAEEIIKQAQKKIKSTIDKISTENKISEEEKSITENMHALVQKQNEFFLTNQTKDVKWRKTQLTNLYNAIISHEQEIFDALRSDLFKSPYESYIAEVQIVLKEIKYLKKNLSKFSKTKHVHLDITQFPAHGKIYAEPYGVVLIMSPWNYPFLLTMEPLVGAIAAGNCVVVKPSRYSYATSAVIEKILKHIFNENYIATVQGGHVQNTALLNQHFDYIFFTGSPEVGKIVMEKAAQHLTPVSLELGGKSPCIVDSNVDLKIAARRVVWGKFLNAGQTCIAPDYVLVDEKIKSEFISAVKAEIKNQFGSTPLLNDEFCKIINEKHFQRLSALCPEAEKDAISNKIAPTVVELGSLGSEKVNDSPIMKEEIFGPLMPIISYSNIDSVISYINSHNKPLALYLFTKDTTLQNKIIKNVRYGGGCINDAIMQISSSKMPFGGVGESGMGSYHGKYSFRTFTHYKSVVKNNFLIDVKGKYAPYGEKLDFIKKILH